MLFRIPRGVALNLMRRKSSYVLFLAIVKAVLITVCFRDSFDDSFFSHSRHMMHRQRWHFRLSTERLVMSISRGWLRASLTILYCEGQPASPCSSGLRHLWTEQTSRQGTKAFCRFCWINQWKDVWHIAETGSSHLTAGCCTCLPVVTLTVES